MTAGIVLGDWREVLVGAYDPERAVVITDPPWGMPDRDRGFPDAQPWAQHVRDILEGLPARRWVIRGPAPAIIGRDYPEPRRLCLEVAQVRRRGGYRPGTVTHRWVGWAVYGRTRVEAVEVSSDVRLVRPYVDDLLPPPGDLSHLGLTPYDAALWMVEAWADPGMIVLDPFAGIGTIGRAAAARGHDYLGAEKVPAWAAVGGQALDWVQPGLGLDDATSLQSPMVPDAQAEGPPEIDSIHAGGHDGPTRDAYTGRTRWP